VREQGLGVATGDEGGGFEERVAESHREMRIAGLFYGGRFMAVVERLKWM
jgi:hypothetical protein